MAFNRQVSAPPRRLAVSHNPDASIVARTGWTWRTPLRARNPVSPIRIRLRMSSNSARSVQHCPLPHPPADADPLPASSPRRACWERDRVRGDSLVHYANRRPSQRPPKATLTAGGNLRNLRSAAAWLKFYGYHGRAHFQIMPNTAHFTRFRVEMCVSKTPLILDSCAR